MEQDEVVVLVQYQGDVNVLNPVEQTVVCGITVGWLNDESSCVTKCPVDNVDLFWISDSTVILLKYATKPMINTGSLGYNDSCLAYWTITQKYGY